MKEGGTGFVLMCLDLLHVCKGSKDKGFIKGNRIKGRKVKIECICVQQRH